MYGNDEFPSSQTSFQANPVPVRNALFSTKLNSFICDEPFTIKTSAVKMTKAVGVLVAHSGGSHTSITFARHPRQDIPTLTEDSTTIGGRIKFVSEATSNGGAYKKFKERQSSCSDVAT